MEVTLAQITWGTLKENIEYLAWENITLCNKGKDKVVGEAK